VAQALLAPGMALGLLIGVPLVVMLVYGFWMAAQLGRGPARRRRRSGDRGVGSNTEHEAAHGR